MAEATTSPRSVGRVSATKGAWWMSRCQEAKKDVEGCDKPGGAAKQAEIPGSPNGATRPRVSGVICV